MNKRQILWLLAAAGVFLALCGCRNTQPAAELVPSMTQIVIGIDSTYGPYTYEDDEGNFVGVDIELSTEAFRRMNYHVTYRAITWSEKNACLDRGAIDCIWSCYTMTDREDEYLWAGPYMKSRQVAMVRTDSGIHRLKQLDGCRVAVISSTKPESLLLERPDPNLPQVAEVDCFDSMEEVFAALRKNYVHAIAGHEIAVGQLMERDPAHYKILDEPLQEVLVGVAFPKNGDEALAQQLTATLRAMEADGTTAGIFEKYGLDPALAQVEA